MNTYAYVGGNPVMSVDPLGLYYAPSERPGWSGTSTVGISIGGFVKGAVKACSRIGGGVALFILENSISSTSPCSQNNPSPPGCEDSDCEEILQRIERRAREELEKFNDDAMKR